MEHKDIDSELVELELGILQAENEQLSSEIDLLVRQDQLNKEQGQLLHAAISKKIGYHVDYNNVGDVKLPVEVWGEIYDEIGNAHGLLIKPSHTLLPYSLIRKRPELQEYVPVQHTENSLLDKLKMLFDKSTSRALEIMKAFNSQNTRNAHMGDLVYWQAWLSGIGFTFTAPITDKEIITFIVQHAEGFSASDQERDIDNQLVEQRYKSNRGPHKIATIKRRIASLSVFLNIAKWPNHTHNMEIGHLLSKLTKMYGGSKPAGRAITKDILDDMLTVCGGSKLIDIRDRALFLFAWGSGGRRCSEVTTADMKDLIRDQSGNYVYTIPKSKTDQAGKGFDVPINGRAAQALTAWLTAAHITEGPIFRSILKGGAFGKNLIPRDVNRLVKKRIAQAGYDPVFYGAHSLRSGFVTEAGRKNKNIGDVMQMTTHRSVSTVMRYYQAGSISNNSASNLAD